MKFNLKLSLLIILNLFSIISLKQINGNITNEEKDQQNFDQYILEYRKNFSEIEAIVLTDKNYTEYIQSHSFTLIYFHSYFDQNSVEFMPTFKFINDFLNLNNSNSERYMSINVVAIEFSDEDNNSDIQFRFRLTTFPFFIIYSSFYQKYIQYTGYMNAQSIITFAKKAISDNIIQINSEKILKQLLNPQLTHLSIFSMKTTFNFDYFYRASQSFNFALFADCIGKSICSNYFKKSIYKYSDLILAKMNLCKNDFICGGEKIMDKKIKPYFILYNITTYDDFIEFISINIIPSVHNMTDFNFELMIKNNLTTIIYVLGKNEKKTIQDISIILQNILKNKKNGIRWATILDPINSQNDYEISRSLSIEVEDYEQKGLILIHSSHKITKIHETYRMNMKDIEEINVELLLSFINEFNSGIIKKDIKSEIIPKTHPKKNLRMVVGKTFDKEILNNFNKTIILVLLTLNMENLHKIEDQIELLSLKFALYNKTLIFDFLDPESNEMPNMPNYDINKRPYYRYYYKNKTKGYIDFQNENFMDQNEIENWIIDNYGIEYGIEQKYGMRMHIDGMTELLKDKNVMKEIQKKEKMEQMKENLGIKDDIDFNEDKIETDL